MTLRCDNDNTTCLTMLLLSLAAWLCVVSQAFALETDQFTVPPEPLADIGPQVSQHVREALTKIVSDVNAELDQLVRQQTEAADDTARARIQSQIDQRLDGQLIAERLYKAVGVGVPETSLEIWIQHPDFKQSAPVLHKVACADSVTGICLNRPLVLIGLAPTVNMFGSYFGTDKIGHFFQQGYENYEFDLAGRKKDLTLAERREKVVAKGKELENGVFGMFLSGIYSNADLAADYAGYKFYLNLTESITIGKQTKPPMLIVSDGRWAFNPQSTGPLLEAFISDHLNEALNPCEYEKAFQPDVREAVKQRAADNFAFYHTTAEREVGHLEQLATWHGENYGHSGFKNLISLSNVMGLKSTPGEVAVTERRDTAMQ